jgi:large subunit ribosomal protein L28
MAQICTICGKGPQFGNKISHAHNVSKRRWNVNLRPVKAEVAQAHSRLHPLYQSRQGRKGLTGGYSFSPASLGSKPSDKELMQ